MGIIPINNIINVTITNTPSGLIERNVNSLGLFTTETPTGAAALSDYQEYVSAAQVAADYGTASVTAQMANAIFAQTPNIRTGNGRLVIMPLNNAVSATQGTLVTDDISANLSNLIGVSDAELEVTIDGTAQNFVGINLTNATTLADVAKLLNDAIPNAIVTATTTAITFTSKKVGDNSTIALGSVSGGSGTDISGASYLDNSNATATAGAVGTGETIAEAIARCAPQVDFVGVITNLEMDDDVVEALSDTIQAQDRLFLHHVVSTADITGGLGESIQQQGNDKTRILGYTESPAAANLFKAAYAGRAFSVNFNGNNTAQTMHLKQLATITPDLGISQTIYSNAATDGVDLYVSYSGVPSVFSTGGNDFYDNPYMDLALKFALEAAGFNHLRQTNTKVPQTERGMDGLKAAYAAVIERFIVAGSIAAGSWTSSETFGDPETFKNNILENGYYIYSTPVTQQAASQRELRKAPLVQIAIKRSGAIHSSDVLVNINN